VFWVISVYFNKRNTLPKSGTFLLGHPVYANIVGSDYDTRSTSRDIVLRFPGKDRQLSLYKTSGPVLVSTQSPSHWEKVKVKFTLEQATKVQRGSTGTALLFL
jgi:hypothetical protein